MQPRPAADEGCLRNWKLHTNANLRSCCWCPLSFSASQEQRADSSPYFASGELCHNSWRADTDTVYFQHLLAYKTLAQSCSVWDLINGTQVGLCWPTVDIFRRVVFTSAASSKPARVGQTHAYASVSRYLVVPCDILLETQDFNKVLLHIGPTYKLFLKLK